jgi:plastocyanin
VIRFRPALSALALALVLALPAAAQAKTKTVLLGPAAATAKKLGDATTVNAFFPRSVTINAGDSVKFQFFGFHNLDVPPNGGKSVDLITPTGQPVAGAVDAAGAPFFFNGLPLLGFNGEIFGANNFGKSLTYSGAKRIQSGAPLAEKLKPVTVKFTKAGGYRVYCDIHPGMNGTVKVLAKGKAVPTAKQDAARVKKQAATAVKAAKDLPTTAQPANTVSLGVARKGGLDYLGMVPAKLTVATGTTVSFVMPEDTYEPHTATFGPGAGTQDQNAYVNQIQKTFEAAPVPDARGVYPSDAAAVSLSPTLHGNGFWNSGLLDAASASPLPDASKLTFGTPGTYTYICVIHPFMIGSISVQ